MAKKEIKRGPGGLTNEQLAFVTFRVSAGVALLMHGVTKLFVEYSVFVDSVANEFERTFLPVALVRAFAVLLPFYEITVGLMVGLGFFTRIGLAMGAALMPFLIFGMGLVQDWHVISSQMIYLIMFFLLLNNLKNDVYCLDQFLRKN